MHKVKTAPVAFKALDEANGTFEAIVSVFDNVDLVGDRVRPGAFADSLTEWKASGDPIPLIFSHRWDDLDAHMGIVLDAAEVEANERGWQHPAGLWVHAQADMDDPAAAKVYRLLRRRSLREFSFAYTVAPDGEKRASDGVNDLLKLGIIEVGPTLKGANPDTRLLAAAKSVGEALDALEAADGAKAWVRVAGCYEERQAQVRDAFTAWAANLHGDELYDVQLEATYDDNVVARVELWADPAGGGRYYAADYSGDPVELGEPHEVTIEGRVVAKAADPAQDLKAVVRELRTLAGKGTGTGTAVPDGDAKADEQPEEPPTGAKGAPAEPRSATATRLILEADLLAVEAGVTTP